jgi:hypothetical protein
MALQLDVQTQFGITVTDAYAKISTFTGTKDYVIVDVEFFATQEARDAGNPTVHRQAFQWNRADQSWTGVTDTDALTSKLYEFLKTLPEFAGAADV